MELMDFKCPMCGKKLELYSEVRRSDIENDNGASDDDDASIQEWKCDNCGTDITLWETPDNTKHQYPYWNSNESQ